MPKSDNAWAKLFLIEQIYKHNFDLSPYHITSKIIKKYREPRLMCYITKRNDLPRRFQMDNLFLLPVKNGEYIIFKGNGFCDYSYPKYTPKIVYFDINLDCLKYGDSESQHLNMAFNSGILNQIMGEHLFLGNSGRKYSPTFDITINDTDVKVEGFQYEIDGNYEGQNTIAIIEAKNDKRDNFNIRQLYYPYRSIKESTKTNKQIKCFFFEKKDEEYVFYEYKFANDMNFNSIYLVDTFKFVIKKN